MSRPIEASKPSLLLEALFRSEKKRARQIDLAGLLCGAGQVSLRAHIISYFFSLLLHDMMVRHVMSRGGRSFGISCPMVFVKNDGSK